MQKKKYITVPVGIATDKNLSPTAKVVYLALTTFIVGKNNYRIVVTLREIIERSGLSINTVVKALNNLEKAGWIEREFNSGSASAYFFTTPEID